MMFITLYGLGAAITSFGFVLLVNKIREKDPRFLICYSEDEMYLPCIGVSVMWPVAAPIAIGILGAKCLTTKEK